MKPAFPYIKLTLTIILIAFTPAFTAAQSIDKRPEKVDKLVLERITEANVVSEVWQKSLNYYRQQSQHKRVHVVKLPNELYKVKAFNVFANEKRKEFSFSMSQGASEFVIVQREVNVISDTEYAWLGDVYKKGTEEILGDATLIENKDGRITGSIDIDRMFFKVRTLKESKNNVIIEMSDEQNDEPQVDIGSKKNYDSNYGKFSKQETNITEEIKPIIEPIFDNNEKLQNTGVMRCSPEHIRVLVLYTPGADDDEDVNAEITLASQESNTSYTNSQITNVEMRVVARRLYNFTSTGNIQTDTQTLYGDNTAQDLRDQYDADVVVLLVENGTYGSQWGNAGTLVLDDHQAYAIVDVSKATGPHYTFTHEVGHIQAAFHNPENASTNTLYPAFGYGHRYTYSGCGFNQNCGNTTIMSFKDPYSNGGNTDWKKVKYFSNPNLSKNGKPLGIANQRENYRVLNDTRDDVADFVNEDELRASIGATYLSPDTYSFTSNPCGSSGTRSYQWRISQNPLAVGSASVVSTSQNYSTTFNSPGDWFVQVDVSDTNGQQATDVIRVYIEGSTCGPFDPCFKGVENPEGQEPNSVELLPAYPNPFNPSTQVSFTLPEPEDVNVSVYDISGKEVAELANKRFSAGVHRVNFEAANLSSGNYIIRMIVAGNIIESQTVTLIK